MMTQVEAIDRYFAGCIRCVLNGQTAPAWPVGLDTQSSAAKQRLEYHGIALLLAQSAPPLTGWPKDLADTLQDEARLQALWEADHIVAVARLIESLHQADITSLVMKGTALAYSIYPEPALRRRGDTDLLIESDKRDEVREVFRQCGFDPGADRRVLQEDWVFHSPAGFSHQIDLHWAPSSSMAISGGIACDHPRQRAIALPSLSPNAMGTGLIDTFVQTCINRTAHEAFGYLIEGEKLFEGDRLIWAVDLHSLALRFSAADWQALTRIAARWGAAQSVLSGINFAQRALDTEIPRTVIRELTSSAQSANSVSTHYNEASPLRRLTDDLEAAAGMSLKLAVLTEHTLPSRRFMQSRYPGSASWPLPALHLRRFLDGTVRMLLGSRR
ncbi:nucleotidyltransferase family protein [Erythrobacter crassostreae]|uniref:Nucleotidyltransferase family protein n=1 Tax=Erythrobacter crassostreae TaxID=2828328 RepID=A0A9X1F1B0_9SPHN|nr:nucleotidyltransferase family protein [Erythrobacter crassostrea]MBV7258287.1 nucleotidyltransferase family protein [Erythrobacter crassostrea]